MKTIRAEEEMGYSQQAIYNVFSSHAPIFLTVLSWSFVHFYDIYTINAVINLNALCHFNRVPFVSRYLVLYT